MFVFSRYDENVFIRKVYSIFNVVELNARTDFAVRDQQVS
jgi:hypothetical protein